MKIFQFFLLFRCQYVKNLILFIVVICVQKFKSKCKLEKLNLKTNSRKICFTFSGTLDGTREKPNYKDLVSNPVLRYSGVFEHNDLYVNCHIYSDNQELWMPVKTSYKFIE